MDKFLLITDFKTNEVTSILNNIIAESVIYSFSSFNYEILNQKLDFKTVFSYKFIYVVKNKKIDEKIINSIKDIEKLYGLPKIFYVYKDNETKKIKNALYLKYKNIDELKYLIIKTMLYSFVKGRNITSIFNKIRKTNKFLKFNNLNVYRNIEKNKKIKIWSLIRKFAKEDLNTSAKDYIDLLLNSKDGVLDLEPEQKEQKKLENFLNEQNDLIKKEFDKVDKNFDDFNNLLNLLKTKKDISLKLFTYDKKIYSYKLAYTYLFIARCYNNLKKETEFKLNLKFALVYLNYYKIINEDSYILYDLSYLECIVEYMNSNFSNLNECLSMLDSVTNDSSFEDLKNDEYNYHRVIAFYMLYAYIYNKNKESDKANDYVNIASKYSIYMKNDFNFYVGLLESSIIIRDFDNDLSIIFMELYLEFYDVLIEQNKIDGLIIAFNTIAKNDFQHHKYKKALECYEKINELFDIKNYENEEQLIISKAQNYVEIARIYDTLYDYKNSEDYIKKALSNYLMLLKNGYDIETLFLYRDLDFIISFYKKTGNKSKVKECNKIKNMLLDDAIDITKLANERIVN